MRTVLREFVDEFIATYAEVLGVACRWCPPLRWFVDVHQRAADLSGAALRDLTT